MKQDSAERVRVLSQDFAEKSVTATGLTKSPRASPPPPLSCLKSTYPHFAKAKSHDIFQRFRSPTDSLGIVGESLGVVGKSLKMVVSSLGQRFPNDSQYFSNNSQRCSNNFQRFPNDSDDFQRFRSPCDSLGIVGES